MAQVILINNKTMPEYSITTTLVDTKPRGTKATYIVCGNGGRFHVSSRSQCDQQKP